MNFSELFSNSQVSTSFDVEVDTCAIIGNSGNLLGSGYGDVIDNHDCVVRLNTAIIDGFEEDVGSKMTFRVLNGTLLKGKPVKANNTPKNWIECLENERLIFARTNKFGESNGVKKLSNANELYFPSRRVNDKVASVEREYNLRLASTGLYTLLIFIEAFGSVSAFGFDFHQSTLAKRHYWEEYVREHDVNHNWKKEVGVFNDLCDQGKINHYS